jgi:hypothetical protein
MASICPIAGFISLILYISDCFVIMDILPWFHNNNYSNRVQWIAVHVSYLMDTVKVVVIMKKGNARDILFSP